LPIKPKILLACAGCRRLVLRFGVLELGKDWNAPESDLDDSSDGGGMENNQKILEKNIEITSEAIKGVEEPNRINFSLTHNDPFPTGDYKTEIYLNGELAKTVEFTIK
jgi:hypothetical protein